MAVTVEAVRVSSGICRGRIRHYAILQDGAAIGEVRSRKPNPGFVVELYGIYWRLDDKPSRQGGMTVRHRKTLREVPSFVEAALSALNQEENSHV